MTAQPIEGLESEAIPPCYAIANQRLRSDAIPGYNAVKTLPIKEPAKAQKDEEGEGRLLWFFSLELSVNHSTSQPRTTTA